MKHQFYVDDRLLFGLEAAAEYDTATPYRYAVGRFVDVATLLRQGQAVTVFTQDDIGQEVVLQTVEQLWAWLSQHFNGFDTFVS